jgi:hypothetical protein
MLTMTTSTAGHCGFALVDSHRAVSDDVEVVAAVALSNDDISGREQLAVHRQDQFLQIIYIRVYNENYNILWI